MAATGGSKVPYPVISLVVLFWISMQPHIGLDLYHDGNADVSAGYWLPKMGWWLRKYGKS